MPSTPSITRGGCELMLLGTDLTWTPECFQPSPRLQYVLVCFHMPPALPSLIISCLQTTRVCVCSKGNAAAASRGAGSARVCQHHERKASPVHHAPQPVKGSSWSCGCKLISFSRSFLKSYFYTHHSFRKKFKRQAGKQQCFAEKALHAELRLGFGWALPVGDSRHVVCYPEGAWAPSSSKSMLGYTSTTLHRIRTPRDRELTRKDIKIFTHH